MPEGNDYFPTSLELGERDYGDGEVFVELRFVEEDGRHASLLFRPAALQHVFQQFTAIRDMDFGEKPN